MDLSLINWLAVVVAALSCFLLGGLWYSPLLFGKAWQRANGFTDEQLKQGNMAKIFGFSFLFALIMSVNLALFLAAPGITMAFGATAGFLAGFGWSAMSIGIMALFERRPWPYLFINGGYAIVALVIMGTIIGAWR